MWKFKLIWLKLKIKLDVRTYFLETQIIYFERPGLLHHALCYDYKMQRSDLGDIRIDHRDQVFKSTSYNSSPNSIGLRDFR